MAIPNVFSKYLPEGGDDSGQSDNVFGKYLPEETTQLEKLPEDKGLTSRLTSFFGKSTKAVKEAASGFKEAWPAGILQAVGAIETTLGVGLDKLSRPRTGAGQIKTGEIKFLKDIGEKLKNKARQDLEGAEVYSQVNLPVENPQSFIQNVKNPRWIGQGVGQNLPNLLTSLGISATVAAITKNPVAALTAGFGSSFSLEGGFAYNDAIKAGVSEEKAEKIGATVGVINGLLDAMPIGRLLSKLPGGTNVKRLVLKEATKSVLKQVALESSTESLQEIVSNAVAKTYDKNRNLFAGTLESAFFGGLMGGGVDVITNIGSLLVTPKTPKQQEEEIKQIAELTGLTIKDVPVETITLDGERKFFKPEMAPEEVTQAISGAKRAYQDLGISYEGEKQKLSAGLLQLQELIERPDAGKILQNQVQQAIKNGTIPVENGLVTLWRVGKPVEGERLTSVAYTEEAANTFKESFAPDAPINKIRVSPDQIKVFIGGTEAEVLIESKRLQKPSLAKVAAERIERKLGGEERLRQSARGMELLKERLTKEEVATKGTQAEKRLLEIVDSLLSGELKKTVKKVKEKTPITPEEKVDLEAQMEDMRSELAEYESDPSYELNEADIARIKELKEILGEPVKVEEIEEA